MENEIRDNSIFKMERIEDEEEKFKYPLQEQFKFVRLMDFELIKEGMEDLTPDGGVKKRIISHGIGDEMSLPAMVSFKYNAYFEHGESPFDSTYIQRTTKKLILRDFESTDGPGCLLGLFYALKSMKRREKSHFIIHPSYGYGELGVYPRIPSNAELFYEIELVSCTNNLTEGIFDSKVSERSAITMEDVEVVANNLKEQGNEFYKDNIFGKAGAKYSQALKKLEFYRPKNGDESKRRDVLEMTLKLNSANCFIKLHKGGRACNLCREVLTIDPRCVKSYFLLSMALWSMAQYKSSLFYLRKADRLSPNNAQIEAKLAEYTEQIDKMYKYAPEMVGDLKRTFKEREFQISHEFKIQCQDMLESIKKDDKLMEIPADFFDIKEEEYSFLQDYFSRHGYISSKVGTHPNTIVYLRKK